LPGIRHSTGAVARRCRYAGSSRSGTIIRYSGTQPVGWQWVAICVSINLSCCRPEVIGLRAFISSLLGVALGVACFLLSRPPVAVAAEGSARGKILFLRCASCHDASTSPSAKIGPNLHGVVGRQVASLEGYKYSAALKSQNFVWDGAHLDTWLTNPNAVAPGTAMAFAGLPEAADRQAIITYLETQ
jgi:cytochrome c